MEKILMWKISNETENENTYNEKSNSSINKYKMLRESKYKNNSS